MTHKNKINYTLMFIGKVKVERHANCQSTILNVIIGSFYGSDIFKIIAKTYEDRNVEILIKEVK